MAEPRFGFLQRVFRRGRKSREPQRESESYPRLIQLGQPRDMEHRPSFKPVARNLRYFSKTPFARRAMNTIKNPISQLDWEICPIDGVKTNKELDRQIEVATYCFDHPNHDDSFRTLIEQATEDLLHGAGAIEIQVGGDEDRPLWMWPVDGLSVQIYAGWNGNPNEARYFQTAGYGGLGNLSTAGISLRNDELIYMRPNPTTSDPFGTGPLEVAFMTISRLLGVEEFSGNVASNTRPSAMMHFEDMDDRSLNAFRSYWRNEVEAQGQTPIVGGKKANVVRLWPDGDTALYPLWKEFLIRELAASFDISPQNLSLERDVNRDTSEAGEDRDWDHAIKPHAHTLQSHLTREALHRRLGFHHLRFKWIGLDRDDELASAKIFQIYYDRNVVTPNDQRDKLGMQPSESQWANLNKADVDIAVSAARGAKVIDDDALGMVTDIQTPETVDRSEGVQPKTSGKGRK